MTDEPKDSESSNKMMDMGKTVFKITGDKWLKSPMLEDGMHHHFVSANPKESSGKVFDYLKSNGMNPKTGNESGLFSVSVKSEGEDHMIHFIPYDGANIGKSSDVDSHSPIDEIVDAASEGAKDDDQTFSVQSEIVKAFPERKIDRRGREYRMIKSMVMSPRKIDKQNDWTDEDEIMDACHEFMINLQGVNKSEDESGLSYRHARLIKSSDARIVECNQLDFPETWGSKQYPAGTWKIGIRLYDEKLFGEIDSGKLRGCSVEGSAIHTPQPLQA